LPVLREPGARHLPTRVTALGLKALVLIGLSVGTMLVDHRQHQLAMVRGVLSAAVWPLQILVHSPLAAWDWTRAQLASRATLMQENAQLRASGREHDLRLLRLEAIEQENLRLRLLLNAAPRNVERAQLAEILRVDLDPIRQRVEIDRGSHDGVKAFQAVIDGHGIFGQTRNVGFLSSEVILLSDPAHAVPVQVERNGLRTIAVGTGEPGRLSLPFLPRNADVAVDDRLVSSGLGGVFPAGYPVGRITDVRRDPSQPLAIVNAAPAAALDRAREVLLLSFPERAPLSPAPPQAPAAASARAKAAARPKPAGVAP
jgi:rod shape-determining protein MreC